MVDRVFGTSKKRATSQKSNRRLGKTLRAAVDKFLLDRESRNLSHKAMVQHRTSLTHLLKFLELQHQVTHLTELELVYLRAWLVFYIVGHRAGSRMLLRMDTVYHVNQGIYGLYSYFAEYALYCYNAFIEVMEFVSQ